MVTDIFDQDAHDMVVLRSPNRIRGILCCRKNKIYLAPSPCNLTTCWRKKKKKSEKELQGGNDEMFWGSHGWSATDLTNKLDREEFTISCHHYMWKYIPTFNSRLLLFWIKSCFHWLHILIFFSITGIGNDCIVHMNSCLDWLTNLFLPKTSIRTEKDIYITEHLF